MSNILALQYSALHTDVRANKPKGVEMTLCPLTSMSRRAIERMVHESIVHNLAPVSRSRIASPRPEPLTTNHWSGVARQLDHVARTSGMN